jgi:hypothetical protein
VDLIIDSLIVLISYYYIWGITLEVISIFRFDIRLLN